MIRYLLIFSFFWILDIQAQDPYHILYTIEDGLPSEEVYDVYVDDDNIVWFTTDRGIGRYNGYEFESFSTSDGLAYNTNYKMIPDDKNRIWILGSDGSISIYENERFKKYMHSDRMKNASNRFLYGMGYDSLGNNFVHHSAFKLSDKVDTFFQISDSAYISKHTFEGTERYSNENTEIYVKMFKNTSFVYIPKHGDISPSALNMDNNSGLFIYPLDHQIRENEAATGTARDQMFKYENGEISTILKSNFSLTTVSKDMDGNIIVCSTDGIYFFREGRLDLDPEHYFTGTEFSDMYQDKEGNYWFSSQKDGLYFIPTFDSKSYKVDSDEKSVSKLLLLDDFLIYFYANRIINYIDKGNVKRNVENKPKHIQNYKILKEYYNNSHLLEYKGQLYKYDFTSNRRFLGEYIILDNKDILFSSSKIKIKRGEETIFSSDEANESTKSRVTCIKHKEGNIWYSTMQALFHISNYDYDNVVNLSKKHALLNVRINDFELDSSGNLWLASIGNGLLFLSKNDQVLKFDKSSGLNSNQINTLLIENDSTIWVGSNQGIDKIIIDNAAGEPTIVSITNFSVRDGLLSNFINDLLVRNDEMWVASMEGIQSIKLQGSRRNQLPSITLKSIQVLDNEVDSKSLLKLKHNENFISFSYEGVSYNRPKDSFYKYKLVKNKTSEAWNYTNDRTVRFTNLNPGTYTFSVAASNKNKMWTTPESITFTIRPHFTSTWWFLILCLFLIGTLAYFIYSRRLKFLMNKNRQEKVLQEAKLRTEIAELSTFRNQFNPHFIFNSLNSIQSYIFKKDIRQANSFLSKFSKLIRESLNLSDHKYVSIEQEFQFLEDYLAMEFLRFPDKFEFEFHNKEDLPLAYYQIPPLLLQPVVENVIKHAFKGQNIGKLDIYIESNEIQNSIAITIIDNGNGIKEEAIDSSSRKSYGIKIVHDRIKLLNIDFPKVISSFSIKNGNNNGTIARFVIPIITLDI